MSKFKKNQIVYFVRSGQIITQAKIINIVNGFCTVKFFESSGGMRVSENRLFATEEEAKASVKFQAERTYYRGESYKEYW